MGRWQLAQVLEVSAEYVQHALKALARRADPAAHTIWVHFGVDGTASSFKLEVGYAWHASSHFTRARQNVHWDVVIRVATSCILCRDECGYAFPHSAKPSTRRTSGCQTRRGGSRTMTPSTHRTRCTTACARTCLWTIWRVKMQTSSCMRHIATRVPCATGSSEMMVAVIEAHPCSVQGLCLSTMCA
jgi:hypothetical protein